MGSMRVELRADAISDLVEAAWFYERQRSGLGDQFTDAMFAHLAYLETVAGGHEVVFGLHRMLAKRFPYALYYKVVGELLALLKVSAHRDPARLNTCFEIGRRCDRVANKEG